MTLFTPRSLTRGSQQQTVVLHDDGWSKINETDVKDSWEYIPTRSLHTMPLIFNFSDWKLLTLKYKRLNPLLEPILFFILKSLHFLKPSFQRVKASNFEDFHLGIAAFDRRVGGGGTGRGFDGKGVLLDFHVVLLVQVHSLDLCCQHNKASSAQVGAVSAAGLSTMHV